MENQIESIKQMLKNFQLDTLFEKERVYVLHMNNPEFPAGNIKVVFSKNIILGFAMGKILYVLPEYFEGGKFFNVFFKNEINTVVQTYQLKEAIKLDLDAVANGQMELLVEIHKKAMVSVKPEELEAFSEQAEALAFDMQNDQATKLFNEIDEKLRKTLDAIKPSENEVLQKLDKIVEDVKQTQDADKMQELLTEATTLLAMVPSSSEANKVLTFISEKITEAKSSTKTPEKQYLDVIKKADSLFDKKKYEDAKDLYLQAHDIDPSKDHPNKRIAEINRLAKKK